MRSSEDYEEPADGPRVATIYNGLSGHGQFVAFRKGDPEGSRWIDNEPLYCDWSKAAVDWLSSSPLARWQGHKFFITAGVTWSLHANHVAAKCRYQEPCVFDASSSRLTSIISPLSAQAFVAVANSDVCIEAKRAEFSNTPPPNPLVARTREIAAELRDGAPAYLHPSAQQILLETPRDCLAVLESAVSWEAEKLYGVEALGPFDEF